ncbi:MAG: hypothetical protein PHY02_06365 [Phycisphaerae bacterium]|nr:hypothetical protein [Phycisphaerae bacterium]
MSRTFKKIKCPCGQETQLVESPEGLRFDKTRHGNGELCGGLCFNCRKPLKELAPKPAPAPAPAPVKKTEAIDETGADVDEKTQAEGDGAADDGPDKMNVAQLREYADKLGVKIPFGTITKKAIQQLIRNYIASAQAETDGAEGNEAEADGAEGQQGSEGE